MYTLYFYGSPDFKTGWQNNYSENAEYFLHFVFLGGGGSTPPDRGHVPYKVDFFYALPYDWCALKQVLWRRKQMPLKPT